MNRETRRASLRAADLGNRKGVTLKVITPYIVDDYGSVFVPETFDESLATRGPVLCWSHEWEEPLGPYVSHEADTDGAPIVTFAFSDFDAVPTARRAYAQVQDGTILDCSVGFSSTERRSPTEDEMVKWPGVREVITKATLDEVSLVLRGAVPGAKVLAVRSKMVDVDAVVEIAKRKAAGEITEAEALVAIDLLAAIPESPPAADLSLTPPSTEVTPEPAITEAELDAAMDVALGRSRLR
jgi:HK97 family phage prohead protease